MSIKKIVKRGLIKIAKSNYGSKLQNMLGGMSEIVDNEAGRCFRSEMLKRLAVNEIITAREAVIQKKSISGVHSDNRIKIRFFHCNENTINVIQTVCEQFQKDQRFDVQVVLFGGSYTAMIAQMNELGLKYITDADYDIVQDKPDISIVYHLEIIYPPKLLSIREHTKMVVLLPLSIGSIWFGSRTVSRMHLDQFNADVCFIGNLCYDRLIEPVGKSVIERMSPPQFDLLYRRLCEEVVYPVGWEKLKGKKTIMWMTDHGLKKNIISDEVSFDLYFHSVINYFVQHEEMGLIIRLHFALLNELLGTYWTLDDYEKFRKFCDDSPNIVWDDTKDYLNGLLLADASIVDVNCSLMYYTLGARKPIGIPLRYDMPVEVNNPELLESYYQIRGEEDCCAFLDMVRKGEDPMRELRERAFDLYITNLDGKNGERIYNKIIERYNKICD